jgi:phosphatidylserine/phosphatidylglycerophosphate/cardiolipin synthase-like enzyme
MAATSTAQNSVQGDTIDVEFLCQGCQTADTVAQQLARFINQATRTLDISIYSFYLGESTRGIVVSALENRAAAGVAVRIAYDAATQQAQLPGYSMSPHPGQQPQELVQALHVNPFAIAPPTNTPDFVKSPGLPSKPIEGYRALMHDKYAILDCGTPGAQVWTGSSNWTDDSWTLQESNIIVLHSQALAQYFTNDVNELWAAGTIASSGNMDSGEVTLQYAAQPARVSISFAPNDGPEIDAALASLIEQTQERLTIAAVVLTSGSMINALQSLIKRGIPIDGIYDATQMEGVIYQWQMVPSNHWKIPAWQQIVEYGRLAGKHSTSYTPTSRHDFMHNKVLVSDNTVVTGSYNFSRHAQGNAENVLTIASQPLAHTYRQYIYHMVQKYSTNQGGNAQPLPPSTASAAPEQPEDAA